MSDTPVRLPRLEERAHKGDAGAVLLVAGSRSYTGAAALAADGASRCGAGYVRVAAPSSTAEEIRRERPWVIVAGVRETADGAIAFPALGVLRELAARSDAVAAGPGLTNARDMTALLSRFVPDVAAPLVLDADGLNALAGRAEVVRARSGATILTPHPGEAARWLGVPTAGVQADREAAAATLARVAGAVVVLKGAGTVVADGDRIHVNDTGNPGLATGGSGDLLTGMIVALLGRGLQAWDAARLGVWLHGRAADLAAATCGESPMTPADVCASVPRALAEAES